MTKVTVLNRRSNDIFYLVSLDGGSAPVVHHSDPEDAFREAKRLTKKHKRPARILMQIGMVYPSGAEGVLVGNFGAGQWFFENDDAQDNG